MSREAHVRFCESVAVRSRRATRPVVERFFGTLKREWTQARSFRTHQEAKAAVIEYIEMFYNSHRRHSTLGYLSPNEFEAQARNAEETRE